MPLRRHLERALKQGRSPPELVGPELPGELAWLWAAFDELCAGRQAGFNGPQPLAWSDLAAWQRLTRTPLAPADVRLLRALDLAYLAALAPPPDPHARTPR